MDIVFKRYIKYRDGYMEDGQWLVPCITCPKVIVYRDREGHRNIACQGGHFISAVYGATQFDEQNVNGQCAYCNKWLAGAQYAYSFALDKKYGPGTAKKLYKMSTNPDFKFKREWLVNKITYYKVAIEKYEAMW